MKVNKLLIGLCTIAAFTACADDETLTNGSNNANGTFGVQLTAIPNGETRGIWEEIWKGDKEVAQFKWQETDKIGLSMVSRNQTPESVTEGDYTLTNYEFKASTETGIDYPSETGYFVTENATVFSGSYVAYYPYNEEYCDPSTTIPVSSPYIQYRSARGTSSEKASQFAGDNSFVYSKPFALDGGRDAKKDIALQNLSGVFKLNLKSDLAAKFGTAGIKAIIATAGDFKLGETKSGAGEFPVKGDLKSVVVAPSDEACTYTCAQEALILHMSSEDKPNYNANGALKIDTEDKTAYMVALPRPGFFSEGYKFYVVDANNKVYEIEKSAKVFANVGLSTIKGSFASIGIKNDDLVETKVNNAPVYVAADEASLRALAGVTGKIYIFNNIELSETPMTFSNNVELIAAKNQGKITVKKDATLTFSAGATINTEIVVEAKDNAATEGLISNENLTIGEDGIVTNNTPFEVATLKMVTVAGVYNNYSTVTIVAPAATSAEPNRGLKVVKDGKFNNFKIVDNYGSVNNVMGTFNNNADAQFLDQVGSKLAGSALNQKGDFICVVDKQMRLNEAVTERPTTIIRLKECIDTNDTYGAIAGKDQGAYDYAFNGKDWSKFAFEAVEGKVVIASEPENPTLTSKIKSLKVEAGVTFVQRTSIKLDIAESVNISGTAYIDNYQMVGGDYNVNGETTTFRKAAKNLTEVLNVTGNFTIATGATATFENNIIARINGTKGVANNGTFNILDATAAGMVPAIVYAKTFSGNGTWANYPTVVTDPMNPYNN